MNPKYIDRLTYLDHLIKTKRTGTPKELAEKVGLSESKVYEYIEFMKNLGAPIKYSKVRKSYYYEIAGCFNFNFIKMN